jgi:hypothetical protein
LTFTVYLLNFKTIVRVEIQVGSFSSNSRSHDGSIIFNKSNTDTPYFRFGGTVTLNGAVTSVLLFLNAGQVNNLAVMPEMLQGKSILVDDAEWERAINAPRNPDYADQNAMAFTNFNLGDIDDDIIEMKVNRQNQLVIAQAQAAAKHRESRRERFLNSVKTGQVENRFPRNNRTTDQLTQTGSAGVTEKDLTDTGAASQVNTKEGGNVTQKVK